MVNEARRLHEQGKGYKAIGTQLGISRDRARALVGRTCPSCGERMGRRSQTCLACRPNSRQGPQTWERRAIVAGMWQGGATIREIAAELGTTPNTVGRELHQYRAEGIELPFRHHFAHH